MLTITLTLILLLSNVLSKEPLQFLNDDNPQMLTVEPTNQPNLSSKGLVIKCFWFETTNYTIFNLKKLENNIANSYSFKTPTNQMLHYNFCSNVASKQCNEKDNQAILYEEGESKCQAMAGPYKGGNTFELLNPKNYSEGVKITLNSGEECKQEPGKNYTINYEIQCVSTQTDPLLLINTDEFKTDQCHNTLKFTSPHGCPDESVLSVVKFFQGKEMIFASILIILGLFEVILGKKLLTPTTYIISAGGLTGLVFLFIIQFTIPAKAVDVVLWVVLGISIIVGVVAAFFVTKYKKQFLGFILGGFCGYLIGTLLYTTVTCNFFPNSPTVTNVLTVIISIAVFAVITYFFFDHIVIFGTSLIGGFFVVFGIGIFIGNFPNLSLLMQLIKNGEKEQWAQLWNVWVYCYMAGWVVLFIGGVVCQYFLNKEDTEKDDYKKYNDSRTNSKYINN